MPGSYIFIFIVTISEREIAIIYTVSGTAYISVDNSFVVMYIKAYPTEFIEKYLHIWKDNVSNSN